MAEPPLARSRAAGVQLVTDRLTNLGFTKRAGLVFTSPKAGPVLQWMGLNTARRAGPRGSLLLNPVCGVRFRSVEDLVAELTDDAAHSYLPPTVSSPLRYLMPAEARHDWVFREDDDTGNAVVARDVLEAFESYGLAYIQDRSTLAKATEALVRGEGHDHQTMERAPVALYLMGRTREATDLVMGHLSQLGTRDDAAAQRYREFAHRLDRLIGSQPAPTPDE